MNQLLKKKSAGRFLMDWAAVIALVVSIVIFTVIQGGAFFSAANAINFKGHGHYHYFCHRRNRDHGAGRI